MYISAKHGDGVELLKQAIFDLLGYQCPHEGQFMARARHVEALELALKDLLMVRESCARVPVNY